MSTCHQGLQTLAIPISQATDHHASSTAEQCRSQSSVDVAESLGTIHGGNVSETPIRFLRSPRTNCSLADPIFEDASMVTSRQPITYMTAAADVHRPSAIMPVIGTPAAHISVAAPTRTEWGEHKGLIDLIILSNQSLDSLSFVGPVAL